MTFAIREFAGTSECQAEDGMLITVSSFFEGVERRMAHRACDMRKADWCPEEGGFRIEGDARIYRPLEALPVFGAFPSEDRPAHPR